MNNDYFEMNDLDSTHSVNTTQNVINPSESQENQDTLKDAANLHHDDTAENNTISKDSHVAERLMNETFDRLVNKNPKK